MSALRKASRWIPWAPAGLILLFPLLFVGRAVLVPGRVLAPVDLLLLMEPWESEVARQFPGIRETQTPLLDCVEQYYPWRVYARRCLRGGELPLWDGCAFCGTPMVANQQSAVFYPPNALFWTLPLELAYDLSAYVALLLAGAFVWALSRELGVSRSGAALAAIAFSSCGFIISWLCYQGPVNSFIWAPAGLWMVARYQRLRNVLSCGGLAAACALMVLGGHAQAGLYALALVGAFAVFSAFGEGPPRNAIRRLWPLVLAVGLGLVIALIQTLPTLELAKLNYRTGADAAIPRGLQFRQLNVLIAPQAHGNIAWLSEVNAAFGFHNYIETCGYVVLIAAWLAVLGSAAGRDRRRWFFAGAGVLGLAWAVEGPHQAVLARAIPLVGQMANVGRAICTYCLCASVLAGYGLDALRHVDWSDKRSRDRVIVAGLVAGLVAAGALSVSWARLGVLSEQIIGGAAPRILGPIRDSLLWATALVGLCGLLTWVARAGRLRGRWLPAAVLTLAAVDAVGFGGSFLPAVDARLLDAEPPTVAWLRSANDGGWRMLSLPTPNKPFAQYLPNLPTLAGLRDVRGYDSLYPSTAAETLDALKPDAQAGLFAGRRRRLLDRLGVRYVVVRSAGRLADAGLRATDRPLVAENPEAWPIAFSTEQPTISPPGPAAAIEWRADSRRIEVPPGSYAWLSETAYPGWRAYDSGQPTALERPYPTHARAMTASGRVDLCYEPGSFACGEFATLAGLAVLAGLVGYAGARGRRGRAAQEAAPPRAGPREGGGC